jgi:methionyl-tRNA synthetase
MIQFIPQGWDDVAKPALAPAIGEPRILFDKISEDVIKVQVQKLKEEKIDIDYFSKVSLKTAKVVAAECVEGSNNLIKCQVEIGDTKKQIVAGVGKYYRPEDMIGKVIVVVDNLAPAKIRGVVSEGMLLAAVSDKGIVLITADGSVESGTPVR